MDKSATILLLQIWPLVQYIMNYASMASNENGEGAGKEAVQYH